MASHGVLIMHSAKKPVSSLADLHPRRRSCFSKQQQEPSVVQVLCRKKERDSDHHPYKVIDITPPPRNLGIRCFPSNMQCGESVTIEDKAYIISAVTYRYQLRKGKYEPSEKRLDVQSTGRYLLNNYLEMLLEES